MDGEKYREILLKYIVRKKLNKDDMQLLQDGAKAHTAIETLEFCDESDISIKQNPPSSPKLNPIEKVWNWLKNEINKLNPASVEELITIIQEVWDSIPQSIIQSYISHNTTVVNDIICSGGSSITEPNRPRFNKKEKVQSTYSQISKAAENFAARRSRRRNRTRESK